MLTVSLVTPRRPRPGGALLNILAGGLFWRQRHDPLDEDAGQLDLVGVQVVVWYLATSVAVLELAVRMLILAHPSAPR